MSFATAPPISDVEHLDDLSLINRTRYLRVTEILNDLKNTVQIYNQKAESQKKSDLATNVVKHICQLCTIPAIGVSLLFPFVSFVTVPAALTSTATSAICDVRITRLAQKRRRNERIRTAAKVCHANIEELLKNVLMDGIVTEQEYDLVIKCYDSFKLSKLNLVS